MDDHPTPSTINFSLTLPLYNEGSILQKNLTSIHTILSGKGSFSFEVIVIDDASKDDTARSAKQFCDHLPNWHFLQNEKNLGRGGTVMRGFRESRGTIVGFIDVDCEASPMYLLDFIPDLLAHKVDGITGMRIYPFSFSTFLRAGTSYLYRQLVQLFLRVAYKDRQSGYKTFRREAILPLLAYTKNQHWFWDTEIMVIAHLAGLRIEERPILFYRDTAKKSTVKLFRDSMLMVRELFRFRARMPQLAADLAERTNR
ncbi:MAG: glycosyltransferase [Patescibacteria group bacterium]|jgi:hypothetical protein